MKSHPSRLRAGLLHVKEVSLHYSLPSFFYDYPAQSYLCICMLQGQLNKLRRQGLQFTWVKLFLVADTNPALGHPIEFICLDLDEPAICKYCGLRYVQDHHH